MEMERIICYGAGGVFQRCISEIKEQYEVVAVTAKENPELIEYNYVEPARLNEIEYDKIVITSEDYVFPIYEYLINELKIDNSKILFYTNICKEKQERYYGQQKEDQIVELILKVANKNVTHYVEMGASHPINLSNTYYFYQKGINGILVEPNRRFHPLIEMVRPRDILLKNAVGGKQGQIRFYECKGIGLSTCIKPDADIHENYGVVEEYDVPMITLNDVMEQLESVPELLSIDVEGMEYELLSAFDFEKYSPFIIIVEVSIFGLGPEERNEKAEKIKELLVKNHYKLVYDNYVNHIYILDNA